LALEINALTAELTERVTVVAPSLLAIVGCDPLTAAMILGETTQVHRFRSKDAFARLNGTAPLPACRPTNNGIGCRAPGIVNSTLPCTASRRAKRASTPPAQELRQAQTPPIPPRAGEHYPNNA
jgi:Transposase IS116/IS110/IS902 family